jgi:sterol desaturase/sphingolipid hydroxylase (fatty acid hydroxylase superfamily)
LSSGRLVKLWPYAAAIGVVALSVAAFILLERRTALDLSDRATGFVGESWRRAFGRTGLVVLGTMLLLAIEPVFLTWNKTTLFVVFVRRRYSALIDLGGTLFFFSTFKTVVQHVFTLGITFAVAKLVDLAAVHLGAMRWELPSGTVLEIIASFIVFYILSSFIGYWGHRLMHWRWFWQLHRFHHAATDLNILTTFRVNPAEALTVLPAVLPFFFLKVPGAGLFTAFIVINQMLALLQHSALPWSLGWLGRWVITAPTNHQVHHSIDAEHRDKNFSNCPLWDHVFGTWYGGPNAPSAYGIPDPAHVERPLRQGLIDVWIFYRDITLALAGSLRRGLARLAGRQPRPAVDPLAVRASIPAE